jgi:hypothetical protein
VPLLDEVNALATLPKDDKPLPPGESADQPPPGMGRADYKPYWQHLAYLAFSAATEASEALSKDGTNVVCSTLIEPLAWPVTVALGSDVYPGMIAFSDTSGPTITLSGTRNDALRGLEGSFRRNGTKQLTLIGSGSADFQIIGGSMAAALSGGQLRDQRGLSREATQIVGTAPHVFLRTRVGLLDDPLPATLLWTTLAPRQLRFSSADRWDFWFRDLPAAEDTATFTRSASHSVQRRGVNNPAAQTRRLVHLNGYEWRLGAGDKAPLPLGPLQFYPLSLEAARFEGNDLKSFDVIGRLHLPLTPNEAGPEPTDRANAVKLTFVDYALDAIAPAPLDGDDVTPVTGTTVGEWPLSAAADAPLIRWTDVNLSGDKKSIGLTFRLCYRAHGVSWTFPSKTLTVPLVGPIPIVPYDPSDLPPIKDKPVGIHSAVLSLDFSTDPTQPTGHSFTVSWKFVWGQSDQLQLAASYNEPVQPQTPAKQPAPSQPQLLSAWLEHAGEKLDLVLGTDKGPPPLPPNLDAGAVQVQWNGIQVKGKRMDTYQVLPGFHLAPTEQASSGFGILSFAIAEKKDDLPALDTLIGGAFEVLFDCTWGEPLQAPANAATTAARVFGSSAGRVDAGYTGALDLSSTTVPRRWTVNLLLNGMVEFKSLVSWPKSVAAGSAVDELITVPAAHAGGKAVELSHVRHTARVLLNQHAATADNFRPATGAGIFLALVPGQVWTTYAIVEHQLVLVEITGTDVPPKVTATGRDARLTVAQEVRFCTPSAFRKFLDEVSSFNTTVPSFELGDSEIFVGKLSTVMRGYLSQAMIDRLSGDHGALAFLDDASCMIVEASVPTLLRRDAAVGGELSNLAYLPGGTVRALLSSLADFQSPRDDPQSWFLLELPFLGRSQPSGTDGLDAAPAAAAPPDLHVDPVLRIAQAGAPGAAAVNRLALALANWEDQTDVQVAVAEFDLARHRFFARLDPSSLRESWYRLNLPAPAAAAATGNGFTSVLANSPTDDPGTLGRPEVLARLRDPRRAALPPAPDGATPARPVSGIAWQPDSLFLFDWGGSDPKLPSRVVLSEFGFLGVGAQLAQLGLVPTDAVLRYHSAVALLPARRQLADGANPQPVSMAVSPFLGLGFDAAPTLAATADWQLALSELLCFGVGGQSVVSVAARFWYPPKPTGDDPYRFIRAWARELQARYAADSPVAVVRLRELYPSPGAAAGSTPAEVTVVYRFLATEQIVRPPVPARQAPALRTSLPALRLTEGQCGGAVMPPTDLQPFELAPPQLDGVQPLRLDNRPGGAWPWGLSALRISIRQLEGATGVAGPALQLKGGGGSTQGRLWWQSLYHPVQYLAPEDPAGRRILPELFRAQAIPGLLPAWPSPLLPSGADVQAVLNRPDDPAAPPPPASFPTPWQPILPGGYTVLLGGERPGAPFVLREHLQVQDLASNRTVASGGVPVMHRAPRPVLLPKNQGQQLDVALQTWAGAFDPTTGVHITPAPYDTGFLSTTAGLLGIDLELTDTTPQSISGGTIPGDWDGKLRFQAVAHASELIKGWFPAAASAAAPAQLTSGGSTFNFKQPTVSGTTTLMFEPEDATGLGNWLKDQPHGTEAVLRVTVGNDPPGGVQNFRQVLVFPLRVGRDQGVATLPYQPMFALFEDPEYNRRLASTTAQQTGIATIAGASELTTYRLTLACDRREYNTTGLIHYLFYLDPTPPPGLTGNVQFTQIRSDGTKNTFSPSIANLPVNTLPSLADQDLQKLCHGTTLTPGDTLILELTLNLPDKPSVQLAVSIVAQPVNPVPDAGYALLRRNPDSSVECVRFAFSPAPSRIELVDPDDLHRQIVRRRAVFQWRDTVRVRPQNGYGYAVQKVTTLGATHFPDMPPP